MAPTICSGKKRQTRTIATTNIRRHGQGAHQLNQSLSKIVNFVAKGSRVPASLRVQPNNEIERNLNTIDNLRRANLEADLIYNFLVQTSAISVLTHRIQRNSFLDDNAVTSSAYSDTENSLDLRLANEILGIDTTTTHDSNTTNTSNDTSLSPSSDRNSLSSHKEKTPSSTLESPERLFHSELTGHTRDCSDNEANSGSNKLNSNKTTTELHSREKGKYSFSYNDSNSDDDDFSGVGSDTDWEADESDSMTSLNTEKIAKLKRGNHPLLSDKLFAKHPAGNNNGTKSRNKQRNADGLLSIAIKTIKLFKRNQLLQQRLTQLQLETTEFIQSVLANPENRHFRENIKQKV